MGDVTGTYEVMEVKEYEVYYDVIREDRKSKKVLIAKQTKCIFNMPLSAPFRISEEQVMTGLKVGTWRKIK